MALVTFLSDFGDSDHYVAAVKAGILKENPNAKIIDITHQILVGDIGHAAHVLGSVFRDFPRGTVHLIGLSNANFKRHRLVAVKLEDHFFVGEDSGIYSLLSDKAPMAVVDINLVKPIKTTFPAKDIMASVVAKLANGKEIQDLGMRIDDLERMTPTRARVTKEKISGNVVRIDHYGNLVTNIFKEDFEVIMKINQSCPYEVNFRREKINVIHTSYHDVTSGECFVIFDSTGRLQIGILQGSGADLLGLEINDQVFIDFKVFI